jgi:serine/threonine protein kinase
MPPIDPSHALQADMLFHERYRVIRCIKTGGMGSVYEIVDEITTRRRALKVMIPNAIHEPELRARFAQEAKVTGNIESDHIVHVSDAGIDAVLGMPFLVMDLLRGEDLRDVSARRGPLPPDDVVLYMSQVARALEKTHAKGIVHRDLKPENLFVTTRDDGTPCVKILDFGVAKIVAEDSSAQRTAMVGTPLYMAPEQIRGDGGIGPSADIYALGHIAYALLVGSAYWLTEARSAPNIFALLRKIMAGLPEAASAQAARSGVVLSAAFDSWFARATSVSTAERFATATITVAQLADALRVTPRGLVPAVHNVNIALAATVPLPDAPVQSAEPKAAREPLRGMPCAPSRSRESEGVQRRNPVNAGTPNAANAVVPPRSGPASRGDAAEEGAGIFDSVRSRLAEQPGFVKEACGGEAWVLTFEVDNLDRIEEAHGQADSDFVLNTVEARLKGHNFDGILMRLDRNRFVLVRLIGPPATGEEVAKRIAEWLSRPVRVSLSETIPVKIRSFARSSASLWPDAGVPGHR